MGARCFLAQGAAVESMFSLSTWLQLKNLKWIIPRWSHQTQRLTFLLCLSFYIVLKGPFSLFVMIILRNGLFLFIYFHFYLFIYFFFFWKNTCRCRYAIFQSFCSLRVRRNHITCSLTFPIYLKWGKIVYLSSANSWVSLRGFHSISSLKASWSQSDDRPDDRPLNEISPEQNFEKQFLTWRSVMTPWQ